MPENTPGGPPALTPDAIQEMARAFMRSRVLLTAYELGVFTALGDHARTSQQMAWLIGAEPRATDRLLCALVAAGLLEKSGCEYRNAPVAAECLLFGTPGYLGGLMHTVNQWEPWSGLTRAVKTGTCPPREPINDRGEPWLRAFIGAMHANARNAAPRVAALLRMAGVRRILDVGGGSGDYAMALARASDGGARATVFDLPNVLPITRDYVAEAGMLDRVDFAPGDFMVDPLGADYDVVFISAIVHMLPPDENAVLIGKAASALAPGGRVVVQDFIMDDSRTTPPGGAFFALNMLVSTEAGDTYTACEIRGWMEAAGLGGFECVETGAGTRLAIGRKPAA